MARGSGERSPSERGSWLLLALVHVESDIFAETPL